ncbi:hypothetical protein [Chengkuizengella sediminis]|uniref:hypothetical protein n=1 Tax=Chengkuizengella sediminis TaxID=1885917 RepID=UPI0013896D68|nr:hypothetical protein [Chengkuizengella sediminis]NDI34653.1 hypothetical protein [Chengkuizengella sediminis]
MYYKFSVHAYNLCLFEESVEMGKKALHAKISDTRMRANTIQAVCNGYYYLGDYEKAKEYLDRYKEFLLPEVKDNANVLEAMLHTAYGNHELAISILQKNLPHCGEFTLLHVVNFLFTLYLQTGNLSAIEELVQLEEKLLSITYVTPFKKAELAHYFKLKGEYFLLTEKLEVGINFYLEAAKRYSKVDLINLESECLQQITNIHTTNNGDIVSIFEKLGTYYDNKVRKGDNL